MFGRMIEGYKAWRRGDKRVAPYGTRGRVFERKNGEPSGGSSVNIGVKPKANLEIKVTRADGRVEVHNIPASVEVVSE